MLNFTTKLIYLFLLSVDPTLALDFALAQANVPPELWWEYHLIVARETGHTYDPNIVGDNGSAIGLLQIHPEPWLDWATEQTDETYDLTHPVDNLKVGLLIQNRYDIPRHGMRWFQWRGLDLQYNSTIDP